MPTAGDGNGRPGQRKAGSHEHHAHRKPHSQATHVAQYRTASPWPSSSTSATPASHRCTVTVTPDAFFCQIRSCHRGDRRAVARVV